KLEEKQLEEEQASKAQNWKLPICYDDDYDEESSRSLGDNIISELPSYSAVTPSEPIDSLSMRDEHLNIISATESDEFIKCCVENLIPNPSESEGENECDVPVVFTTFSNVLFDDDYDFDSGDDHDDDSLYYENIEYVEASPHDSEFVSLEVEKIVIPEDEEIEDDNLHEKLLKVDLLIAKIEAFKDNPTPYSEFLTKSSSTSPKSVLEETTTFHNSLPEFENLCFDLEEISSGSTTTQSDISLPEYDSFIFDLSNDQCPPTDRSVFTHKEFDDEPAHIISPPEYDCFHFRDLPNSGGLISSLNSGIRENLSSTTCVNLPEKSPDLLSHQGLEAFQPSAECPMIINGKNIPLLDVPLFHFYPLDQLKYGGIRLNLLLMSPENEHNSAAPSFTVTVDAIDTSAGVSSSDRAKTILALASPTSGPGSFRRPGHVFPLKYWNGEVLRRAGHTEASVVLVKLAGLDPVSVLSTIVNSEDGSIAPLNKLRNLALDHGIPLVLIADLIRVHSECLTGDIFGSGRCDCGNQLTMAMQIIKESGRGALIYLRGHEGRGIGLGHKLRAYNLQDLGHDTVETNLELGFAPDSREYGIGAQMLRDIEVQTMRLMTNNPKKFTGLKGYGLAIVERVPVMTPITNENRRYLETKRTKMGHIYGFDIPGALDFKDVPNIDL
nr:monofunctional riboflavin biosynthesis protein RIBA 3, chloroplastic [Tanacetum cinerariifolium]